MNEGRYYYTLLNTQQTGKQRLYISRTAIFYEVHSHLSGVMVSVLATGPNVHRFKASQGDEFLRAIKIHSTPSFGGEVKPSAPCCKILWHVKTHFEV
jgi:hypothetical protein